MSKFLFHLMKNQKHGQKIDQKKRNTLQFDAQEMLAMHEMKLGFEKAYLNNLNNSIWNSENEMNHNELWGQLVTGAFA